jgi:large subunit ribosomal protein L10
VKKEDKERVVSDLTERLKTSQTLVVADYRGLTMTQIDELRGRLLEHGAKFSVVKNTLTRRAAEAAGADALLALLEGPTAIAFLEADGDPVAVAKALRDVARDTRVLAIRGGVLEGAVISAEDVENLATLPPADVLRAQLLGAIAGPMTTIVGLFTAPLRDLVGVIDARIDQLRAQGDTSEPAAEPPVRDSGPVEGAPGEPGGSPGTTEEL